MTARIKKWGILLTINLITICLAANFIREFVSSEPIHFFSDQPRRLLWVMAIAGVGGVVVWAFDLLSVTTRRGLYVLWRYAVGFVVAYLLAWAGAFTYLCHNFGVSLTPNRYLMYLFMAWSSEGREMAGHVWPDGRKLMDHALFCSVLGFIPLAVLAAVLLHRIGQEKNEPAA